ncbi:MAG: ABC transporter permease [Rikenellaceae bacterium]
MSNIKLVIAREFNERVRKKSFIIMTLLMPLLMALLTAAPVLLMEFSKTDLKEVEVIDESGIIFPSLESNDEVAFHLTSQPLEELLAEKNHFGVLYIGEDILTNNSNVRFYTNSASSMMLESSITSSIASSIEAQRLKEHNIENLDEILRSVKAKVSMQTVRNDKSDGAESSSSSMAAMGIGYILGFILYLFLIIYGTMVMTSVIEEKGSRVLEVLVSSVRPFDLLMGKIISIALVAITQIAIWAVLMLLLLAVALPMMMPADLMQSVEAMQSGVMASGDVMSAGMDAELVGALATLTNFGYISQILLFTLLFLVGGYLLYSAMFAAVGSAVDTVEDSQNLQLPIMLPIMLAFIVQMMVAKDPNSMLIQVFSLIPFTSPVIMMARIPHGIPMWEVVLSLVLLYGSFVAMVWIASKIYRVGIFMHGKKPSLKEIWRWTRYKY